VHGSRATDKQTILARIPTPEQNGAKMSKYGSTDCLLDRRFWTVVAAPASIPKDFPAWDTRLLRLMSRRFVEFTKKRVPSAEVQKMDMRHLEFAEGSFDGLWSSFSFLHIRERDTERTLSGFKSVLRGRGLFFAGLHRGANTD